MKRASQFSKMGKSFLQTNVANGEPGVKIECSMFIACMIHLNFSDRTKSRVAVLKSRPSMVNQQHYNLKNIYGSEVAKGVNNKVC